MIREAISALVSGRSLSTDEAAAVMEEIMTGEATPAQFAAFVTALRMKGETADEITGLARVMRQKAARVEIAEPTVDTCGTGGDGQGTFNVSTAAAFVVAGAGLKVAKHGNRAMTSHCGSADVLEALGVRIDLGPEGVRDCLERAGIGFMFAPVFHPAMKYAVGPRREIGIRTVFNILGPLTNPAGAGAQVVGVSDVSVAPEMAWVLQELGCRHGMVIHGEDGLDEISISGTTSVWEVSPHDITCKTITPEEFGLPRASIDDIRGGSAEENAAMLKGVLGGERGPRRNIVLLNAAAALVVGGLRDNLAAGVELASEVIDSGAALSRLDALLLASREFGE